MTDFFLFEDDDFNIKPSKEFYKFKIDSETEKEIYKQILIENGLMPSIESIIDRSKTFECAIC